MPEELLEVPLANVLGRLLTPEGRSGMNVAVADLKAGPLPDVRPIRGDKAPLSATVAAQLHGRRQEAVALEWAVDAFLQDASTTEASVEREARLEAALRLLVALMAINNDKAYALVGKELKKAANLGDAAAAIPDARFAREPNPNDPADLDFWLRAQSLAVTSASLFARAGANPGSGSRSGSQGQASGSRNHHQQQQQQQQQFHQALSHANKPGSGSGAPGILGVSPTDASANTAPFFPKHKGSPHNQGEARR